MYGQMSMKRKLNFGDQSINNQDTTSKWDLFLILIFKYVHFVLYLFINNIFILILG